MTLIFDSELDGHHLEYIHHLWCAIAAADSDEKYLIAIPESQWGKKRELKEWPDCERITLRLIKADEINIHLRFPFQKRARKECRLIQKIIDENIDIKHVIMANMAPSLPLLPYYIPKGIKISGIVFELDFYAKYSGLRKLKERLNLWLMARNPSFESIFLLNAPNAVEFYNKAYRTKRFKLLVDPVPQVDFRQVKDIRPELGIDGLNTVFLHFGAMQARKGTLIILKALLNIEPDDNRTFIFAGKVSSEIKGEFYQLTEMVRLKGYKFLIEDRFVDFEELHNLCYSADCLLAPYFGTACSSGVIGYGAVFGKPVIGSNDGLLGELIELNNLGITIPVSVADLAHAISLFKKQTIRSSYTETNTVGAFTDTILYR